MNKIIFLQGLPASGKSTWAKQYCIDNPEFVHISKNDIRKLMGDLTWNREFELEVVNIQREIGNSLVKLGKSLIIDDINFSTEHKIYWQKFASYSSSEFEIKTFDTDVEECIRRDESRQKSVGKEVIYKMYNKYIKSDNII